MLIATTQAPASAGEGGADAAELMARVERLADLATFDVDLHGPPAGVRTEAYRRLHGLPDTCRIERHEHWLARVHEEDRERADRAVAAAMAGRAPYDVEDRIRRADDGRVRWIAARGDLIRDPDGRPRRLVGVHMDVTERKEAEREARRNAALFRHVFDAAPIGILRCDVHGAIAEANDAFLAIVGRDREDLAAGLRWTDLTPPEHRRLDDLHLAEARTRGVCTPYEKAYVRKDGSIVPVLVGFSLSGADRTECVAFVLDLSQRRDAAQSLERARRRLETILSQLPAGVLVAEPDGEVSFANLAAEAVFTGGIASARTPPGARTRMRAADASEPLPPDRTPLSRALRGETVQGEELAVDREGRGVIDAIIRVNAAPLLGPDGERTGAVAAFEDVTERRRLQERQKLLLGELEHRIKNTLAVVLGVAGQTLRPGRDIVEAREAFSDRLRAMAAAHDALVHADWTGAPVAHVVAHVRAIDPRIRIHGPEAFVTPAQAVSLALVVHELATNALKHGALSRPEGRVVLTWRPMRAASSDRPGSLALIWTERGGPPAVRPGRSGFGVRLIETALRTGGGGRAELRFRSRGLACRMLVDLASLTGA